MTNLDTTRLELNVEPLRQTDEEKIEALMRLGISRKRSLFIVKMHHEKEGDTVNVSLRERQKDKVS